MKKYKLLTKNGGTYEIKAHSFGNATQNGISLLDEKGEVIAVVLFENIIFIAEASTVLDA